MLSSDVTRMALETSGWMPVTGLRIRFALAGKFALFTVRVGIVVVDHECNYQSIDDRAHGGEKRRSRLSGLQMDKAWHGEGRCDEPRSCESATSPNSMRLADCAHGAVTQLTGHIIAMIDPTREPRGLGLCNGGAA